MEQDLTAALLEVLCTIMGEGILYSGEANQEKLEVLIKKHKEDIIKYAQGTSDEYVVKYLRKYY